MSANLQDLVSKIKAVLPIGWFGDTSPVLDTVLTGLAAAWAGIRCGLRYFKTQSRIASATGFWLDGAANDFFGGELFRLPDQSDDAFRVSIKRELQMERATRGAISALVTALAGQAPAIFEPANSSDTGGYGGAVTAGGGLAYGLQGGWGNLSLPLQAFVTVSRSFLTATAPLAGWDSPIAGYGTGQSEWSSSVTIQGLVTDADISSAILTILPVCTIVWIRFKN